MHMERGRMEKHKLTVYNGRGAFQGEFRVDYGYRRK